MKIWLTGSPRTSSSRLTSLCALIVRHHLLRLLLLSMCWLHGFCAAECPGVCDCKWKDGKESVMCVDTNLTAIPQNLDPGVLVFNFAGNSLLTLANDLFELAGLMNLQKLHLVRCNIKYIERYAFRTLKNLVDLDLSHNVLTIVPSQAFAPIPDLRELRLNGNPILKIGSYAFTHVHQLIRLEISECRIGYIDPKAFNGLENSVEWLKLNRNRVENVAPETFTILQTLHGLDLSENPLNCSCLLRPLREWMVVHSLSVGRMPSCRYPLYNTNKSWDRMHDNDFACLPSVYAPAPVVYAYEGDNVTLTCRIAGVPSPHVNWTLRNRLLQNSTIATFPVANTKRSYLIHFESNSYSNLTILSLEMQDSGEYACEAENKAGKVNADIELIVEKPPMGTILSEKAVLIGILLTAISIIFLCSIIVFIRVMYCKHDTEADIESKRRIISEKIEMKRNSANLKRSSSILPTNKPDNILKLCTDDMKTDLNQEKYPLNSISKEDSLNKAARPKYLKELNSKTDSVEHSQSPSSSIFESHIGEIALQHHILHKKQLPSGKLYTTAMAFMTDDMMMNYTNDSTVATAANSTVPSTGKKTHYNTMPRNYLANGSGSGNAGSRSRKNLSSNYPRVSESQSPLLKSKYYGSSSESLNSNAGERRLVAKDYDQYGSYQKSNSTPVAVRRSKNGCAAYPSLPSSPDKDKYWLHSNGSTCTKETPLLNSIYNKKPRNSNVNYCPTYTEGGGGTSSSNVEAPLGSAAYDYHAVQLERFLDEYRRLHSELTRMKETCEKFSHEGETPDYLAAAAATVAASRGCLNRSSYTHRTASKLSLADRPYDWGSFDRRCNSRSSLHRTLSAKSRSFTERPLQSKSSSFERSVSFVPTLKDSSAKAVTSDDVSMPKSILKKKNESYYRTYKASKSYGGGHAVYRSSTLPTRRTRLRRYSDSSMDGVFVE